MNFAVKSVLSSMMNCDSTVESRITTIRQVATAAESQSPSFNRSTAVFDAARQRGQRSAADFDHLPDHTAGGLTMNEL